jgi:hypothetical protein
MFLLRLVRARTLRLTGAATAAALALLSGAGAPVAGADASLGPQLKGPELDWTITTPVPSPPPLAGASAAYDADNSTVVLFGGMKAGGTLNDTTWVWNGQAWTQPSTAEPPARQDASMAFDPDLHQLILFGGQAQDGSLLSDTWAWNGASWVPVAVKGASPTAREGAALAYGSAGRLVLFGGTGYPAGAPSPSTVPAPTTGGADQGPGAAPGPATGGAATGDHPNTVAGNGAQGIGIGSGGPGSTGAGNSRRVLATGALDAAPTVLGDTWIWTSSGWVPFSGSGPPARTGATLSYDRANGTAALFGGEATAPGQVPAAELLPDTWVWTGSMWAATQPALSPPARTEAAADYDAAAGGPVLVGGEGASGDLLDAWVWSGSTWLAATLEGHGRARQDAAVAFDVTTGRLLVFGGTDGTTILGDTGQVMPVSSPRPASPSPVAPTISTPATAGAGHSRVIPTVTTVAGGRSSPAPTSTTHPAAGSGSAPTLQTSQRTLRPDSRVWLTGAGYASGTEVTLTFHSVAVALGRAQVASDGTFRIPVTVPSATSVGQHHIQAEGTAASGVTTELDTAVFVVAPGGSPTPLSTTLTMVGLALLIPAASYAGMGLFGSRRRRGAPPAGSETE